VVTYWDASALISMLARGPAATTYRATARDFGIITWWGTYVECAAAIARHARQGSAPAQIAQSYRALEELSGEWIEIGPNERLRRAALRAAKNHDLRAGDALQLGAAMIASNFEPHTVQFLTEDVRLKQAAEREDFVVD
jgi:predicted nucleic acid-binding protein